MMTEFEKVCIDFNRMCKVESKRDPLSMRCDGCKIDELRGERHCLRWAIEHPEETEVIVKEWTKKNSESKLTYRQRLEQMSIDDIIKAACPYNLFGGNAPESGRLTCTHNGDCKACWDEVENDDEECGSNF